MIPYNPRSKETEGYRKVKDRRQTQVRTHTVTLGVILVVMGSYAFAPFDTMFTASLAREQIEALWGTLMIGAGILLAYSGSTQTRFVRWAGNTSAMLTTGWTIALSWSGGIITPTLAACGVICFGCAATMIRDAISSKKYRCMLRATGQWES